MASGVLKLGRPGGVGMRSGGPYCGASGRGSIGSSCRARKDLDDEASEWRSGGRSPREKDSLRRTAVRARRVTMEEGLRRRLGMDGWWLRSVGREERSVMVSRRCGWWMLGLRWIDGTLVIAAGGLPVPDAAFRLPFFFLLDGGGGGGRSEPEASQSPTGNVVFSG